MTLHALVPAEKVKSQFAMDNYRHAGRLGFANMYGMDANGDYTLLDLGSNSQPWSDLYLKSGGTIYIGTAAKSVIGKADIPGYAKGCQLAYYDADNISIKTGEIEVDGTLYTIPEYIIKSVGSPSNDTMYYIYIDKSTISASEIDDTNIDVSTDVHEWSPSKGGWYRKASITGVSNVTGVLLYSPVGAGTYALTYTNATDTLSFGGGAGVVVTQDCDIILIDSTGANSVRVLVDFSALPGSDQTDASVIISFPASASDRCIGFFMSDGSGDVIPFDYNNNYYNYRIDFGYTPTADNADHDLDLLQTPTGVNRASMFALFQLDPATTSSLVLNVDPFLSSTATKVVLEDMLERTTGIETNVSTNFSANLDSVGDLNYIITGNSVGDLNPTFQLNGFYWSKDSE
ncbi:MAG: hypothetical protein GY756_09965 [bacterium]|nr:hypothetical protein [bacterium]